MPMLQTPPARRITCAAAAVIAALAFSVPLLFLLAAGGNYLAFANESLAYRYFANVRILDGQGSAVWTAQGQLTSFLQHFIVIVLQAVTAGDLKTMLQLYGICTNLVVALLMLGIYLVVCFDYRLVWSDKAVILILGPAIVLGTINAGFYYWILPDYYAFSLVIITASIYLALRNYRNPSVYNVRDAWISGVLCGVAASNKLTLLGPAGIVALLAIVKPPFDFSKFWSRSLLVGLICVGSFLFVFLGFYGFHPRDTVAGLRHWFGFLRSAGPEPGFWEGNFWTFQRLYNYDKVIALWAVTTLFLAVDVARFRTWRPAIILIANLFVAILLALGLYKRGAGTTFFEISSILAGLTALMLAIRLGRPGQSRWLQAIPAMVALAAISQFDFAHNWFVVVKSRELANTAWEIRDYTTKLGRPVAIIIPDESYVSNGVEDLFNKGLRDLATNNFGAAKVMKERLAPRTDFRQEAGLIEIGMAVVWFEKWDPIKNKALTETSDDEARRWRSLSRLALINDCRTWRTGYSDQILARVCLVDRL
jgi:hypothetical protein